VKHFISILMIASLFVAVCLINSSGAAEPPSNPDIYFPLTPRTMIYECVKKGSSGTTTRKVAINRPQIIDGAEVTLSVVTDPDLKFPVARLYQKRQDGIYFIGMQVGDLASSRYDVKIPVLKAPIKPGIFFDSDVKLSFSEGSPTTSHFTHSIEDSNAVVTVPYGRFTNCIKLKSTVRGADTVNDITSWLAPNIGTVKTIEVKRSNKTNNITETEVSLKAVDSNAPAETSPVPMKLEKETQGTTDWLTDNAIANMRGVDFLLLYVPVIVVAMFSGWLFIRSADTTGEEAPLPLPSNPDPYELAYLRGGVPEVVRLAAFKLIQAHCLVSGGADLKLAQVEGAAEPPGMSDIERLVYKELATPQKMRALCKRLASEFKQCCDPMSQRLYNDRMLSVRTVVSRARLVRAVLLSGIIILGGYKLVVALSRGRTNVIFLILVMIFGAAFTMRISVTPRLSRRGKDYLKRFYSKLKDERMAVLPSMGIEDDKLILLVAVMGFVTLRNTPYAQYLNVLTIPASSSFSDSSFSGGCGGGGGGGGCGGCGGGN